MWPSFIFKFSLSLAWQLAEKCISPVFSTEYALFPFPNVLVPLLFTSFAKGYYNRQPTDMANSVRPLIIDF